MTGSLRVAVIGLGAMGLPVAVRLATSLPVAAFDMDPGRVRLAAEAGVVPAGSALEAVQGAKNVVLVVRSLEQAEEALFGSSGAAKGLMHGSVVILMSTVGAEGAGTLHSRLSELGVSLLDAPISGGASRARTGELLIFLGGDRDTRLASAAVLELLSSKTVVVGDRAGDGQTMKTVNQLLCGVHIAAAAEALALARALGLDVRQAVDVLGEGAAASFMLANRGPRMIAMLEGEQPPVLSRTDIFVKDMRIVREAAKAAGLTLPLASLAERLFLLAAESGRGAEDDSALAALLLDVDASTNLRRLLC